MSARDHDEDELRAELASLQSPAPAAAGLFDVQIKFTDGTYRNKVAAANADKAFGLALIDARMGSPFGTFFGARLGFLIERMQV
nr:hypothetical protein [uncultured Duganella sp.]